MACFCSALIVGRLAPFGSRNTRFWSVPVSCGPRTGADASGPRHETRRNVAGPRSLGSRKGLRRRTSPVLYAPSAPSAMALPHGSPAVRPGEACRIPRPRWRTRGRCAACHGRNGARDRPCRHARRPMMSPVPAPAAPAPPPWCPWRRRTPGRRSRGRARGRARRRRTPCSRTSRWPCARRRCRPRAAGPGAPASNSRPTRPGPPPAPLAGLAVTDVPPRRTPRTPDSRMTLVTRPRPDPGRIPAPRRRPGARLAAPVHGHEGTGMGPEDAVVDWLQCIRRSDGGRLT